MSKTTARGRVFTDNERALRASDATEYALGRAMYERIVAYGTLKVPREIRKQVEYIHAKQCITPGRSEEQTLLDINEIRQDVALLPAREASTFDMVPYLISKVPDSVRESSDRTYRERLLEEMTEYEVLHPGKEKWTFDTLKALIAAKVSVSTGAGKAYVTTRNGDAPCFNCGKVSCDKGHAACEKLGRCRIKYCTCILRNGRCLVQSHTPIPAKLTATIGGKEITRPRAARDALADTQRRKARGRRRTHGRPPPPPSPPPPPPPPPPPLARARARSPTR